MGREILIDGMLGLGDNIYQRAFVRQLAGDVYVKTPWPELYKDLPVKTIPSATRLRTQRKNEQQTKDYTASPLRKYPGGVIRAHYMHNPIIDGLSACFKKRPGVFDLPDFGPSRVAGKYVVVRPSTVRSEWRADSRNPKPGYITKAAMAAKDAGFQTVSIADINGTDEWGVDVPECDIEFNRGELSVSEMLAVVRHAAGVIAPVGWALPACIATKTPLFLIFGGQGGYNSPLRLISPELDISRIFFAVPNQMCQCKLKEHDCDKTISGFNQLAERWLSSLE